ncbi:Hint domain-containing protein [Celeribacter neptunius]|uniref:Hint domain-containing protein n=1 Tax=Celeribacter neptunius TaxID=588602 RepID=A0A1I3W7P7_9RHOB|nr:Hint domain-containing protein [Celeribacter neptunius]SFK02476.1 Hint domain-containing protein [Celeribacter neptunius]
MPTPYSGSRPHTVSNTASHSAASPAPRAANNAPLGYGKATAFARAERGIQADRNGTHPEQPAWTVRRVRPVERPSYALRRYDIQWLARNGDLHDKDISAPAIPIFESAFNAFARGALLPTPTGPVAVEDLLPGDLIETVDQGVQRVQWIGSMPLDTHGARSEAAKPERLYRITADTFGLGRPAPDLMLGAGARYLLRADALKAYLGVSEAMAPVPSLVDGVSVIEVTPISTVRSYHIALSRHSLIRVNGVELESYHPGTTLSGQLLSELRPRFMELFPYLESLPGFGPLCQPRLSPTDLLELSPR